MRRWFGVLAVVGALLGACSGGGDGDSGGNVALDDNPFLPEASTSGDEGGSGADDDPDQDTAQGPSAGDAGSPLTRVVSLFPERLGEQVVYVSDLASAADQAGIVRRCEDDDAAASSVIALSVSRDDVPAPGAVVPQVWVNAATANDSMREEFGFGPCDVDVVAEDLTADLLDSVVVATTPRIESIDDAVQSDPLWSDMLQTADPERAVAEGSTAGGVTYVWGEDPLASDPQRRSPARRLGRGGVLHVDQEAGLVIRGLDVPAVDAALSTRADGSSLAADEDVVALMDAAAALEAHTILLARPTARDQWIVVSGVADIEDAPTIQSRVEAMPLPARVNWMAAAWSFDARAAADEAIVVHLLAAHDDEAAATGAVDAMERFLDEAVSIRSQEPWSERFGPTTVEASGRLVVTTSRMGMWPSFVFQSIFSRDSLFVVD